MLVSSIQIIIITISDDENAHVAGITNGYNLGIWCGMTPAQTPCTDYQTKITCWSNAAQNCTWPPINETVRPQGGCCEPGFKFILGECRETADEMCFANAGEFWTPQNQIDNGTTPTVRNPPKGSWNQYCEQAAASYGFWTEVGNFSS